MHFSQISLQDFISKISLQLFSNNWNQTNHISMTYSFYWILALWYSCFKFIYLSYIWYDQPISLTLIMQVLKGSSNFWTRIRHLLFESACAQLSGSRVTAWAARGVWLHLLCQTALPYAPFHILPQKKDSVKPVQHHPGWQQLVCTMYCFNSHYSSEIFQGVFQCVQVIESTYNLFFSVYQSER